MLRTAALLTVLVCSNLSATTRVWPDTVGVCSGTLQACVNAANANDTVQIITADVDAGSDTLSIAKPLHLMGGSNVRPVFRSGQAIAATYSAPGTVSWNLTIEGLTFSDGSVAIAANGGTATIALRNLDITSTNDAHPSAAISVVVSAGTANYDIANSKITVNTPSTHPAIATSVNSSTAGSTGAIHDNRIAVYAGSNSYGVQIGGRVETLSIYANQLRGGFSTGIIVFPSSSGSSSANIVSNSIVCVDPTRGAGIYSGSVTSGSFNAQIFNNTIIQCHNGLTVAFNPQWTGRVTNNLFSDNFIAIDAEATDAPMANDHNIIWNETAHVFHTSATTYYVDPKLTRGADDPRPASASPAIDAGNSIALSTLLDTFQLPQIDADGTRRFKGAAVSSLVDIGAFEFGDNAIALLSPASGAALIDLAALNGNAGATPIAIQNQNPDSYTTFTIHTDSIGLAFDASNRFEVVAESTGAAPTPQTGYNVFAPAPGAGALQHTTSATNVFGFTTQLNDPYLNGHPERIVLATHRPGSLFDHPFGATYSFGSWFLQQTDAVSGGPDFPSGLTFDVYAQDASLNAFVWKAQAAGSATRIDHVLLNGERCGRVVVANSNLNAHPIEVFYDGRWGIYNVDGSPIAAGTPFYVLVDEAATQRCRYDHIFHDGFENLLPAP